MRNSRPASLLCYGILISAVSLGLTACSKEEQPATTSEVSQSMSQEPTAAGAAEGIAEDPWSPEAHERCAADIRLMKQQGAPEAAMRGYGGCGSAAQH